MNLECSIEHYHGSFVRVRRCAMAATPADAAAASVAPAGTTGGARAVRCTASRRTSRAPLACSPTPK